MMTEVICSQSTLSNALESLTKSFSKVAIDASSANNDSALAMKEIHQAVSSSFRSSPEMLLAQVINEHGEQFLDHINPKLKVELIQLTSSVLIGGGSSVPSTTRFWSWLKTENNRELFKARTLSGLLNTASVFCETFTPKETEAEYVRTFLGDLIIASQGINLSLFQVKCLLSCGKIRKQNQILNQVTDSNMSLLSDRIYLGKITFQPVAYVQISMPKANLGKFFGRKGTDVKNLTKALQDYCNAKCDGIDMSVALTVIEGDSVLNEGGGTANIGTVHVVMGAWVTDDDIFTRFTNRNKFTKETCEEMSDHFHQELKNRAQKAVDAREIPTRSKRRKFSF